MDPSELHWRTNSSFSPLSRRWDLGSQSDELLPEYHIAPACASASLVHSKRSRSRMSSDQYSNHHHSTSDGAVSYLESPGTCHPSRWGDPLQRFEIGEVANPSGSRPDATVFTQSAEKCVAAGISPVSNSVGSGSPSFESGHLGSSGKQPIVFPRNVSGRRSFMSKPVYPLSFRNPISDPEPCGLAETSSGGRFTTSGNNKRSSPQWIECDSSPELKFHKTLTELQKIEASPGFSTSSRREGFRWSNASSYDFGIEADGIDASDHASLEYLRSPVPMGNQKCALCKRLLSQKSPWSSHRIIRNGDMPVAGVLSCKHVFHADCLEEMTPRTQIHDPPCPVCSRGIDTDGSFSFSEPLQAVLRPKDKPSEVNSALSGAEACNHHQSPNHSGDTKRNHSSWMLRRGGSSLFKGHFKKHLSFKGKMGRDLFGAKVFRSSNCSSLPSTSSSICHTSKKQPGCSSTGPDQSSR